MKIKCVKAECPLCKVTGSIQLFFNRDGILRYARTRHFSHTDKDSKKPQFTYCKIEDLQALKTLISQQGISLTTEKGYGSIGQSQNGNIHDPKLQESSPIQENTCGRSLVWFRTRLAMSPLTSYSAFSFPLFLLIIGFYYKESGDVSRTIPFFYFGCRIYQIYCDCIVTTT